MNLNHLFLPDNRFVIIPTGDMSRVEKIQALQRLLVYLILIGLITSMTAIEMISRLFVGCILFLGLDLLTRDGITKERFEASKPTINNPYMNRLPGEDIIRHDEDLIKNQDVAIDYAGHGVMSSTDPYEVNIDDLQFNTMPSVSTPYDATLRFREFISSGSVEQAFDPDARLKLPPRTRAF